MSDDLIKRSEAIKELRNEYPVMPMFKSLREEWTIKTEGYRKAEEVIMRLPSADRPRGKWIWMEHPVFERCKCSVCGYCRQLKIPQPYNFCPNCGADMREREDE